MNVNTDIARSGDIIQDGLQGDLGQTLMFRASWAHIDVQNRMGRHDIVRAATIDARRINAQTIADHCFKPERDIGRGQQRITAVLGVAPCMCAASSHDDREIATTWSRAGERAVRERRWLISECSKLIARSICDQRCRSLRTYLLIAVEYDLIADPLAQQREFERAQRRQHDGNAALHVGDAGTY
ncbi:hypothetical protein TS85_19175 [Sphingomonas hengshuiensis]|uniref:Uncharacterized protein n=1 Tax=Sphingomonas hengshuiensis TaxID=1609977 RepID=A0A7U4LGS5_9SPHN|nr:hypothetical protein TS85_19175 [Sphingomonas hengshuiensis]